MLKSSRKRARAVQPPARGGDPVELVAALEVLGALRLPLDELEHEHELLGEVGDHGRPDAGVGGRDRVQVLVLAVDREQAGVLGRHADHEGADGGLDLVVRVGEPAGELGHVGRRRRARAPGQDALESSVYAHASEFLSQ